MLPQPSADNQLANGFGAQFAASYARGSVRTAGVAGTRPLDSVEPVKLVGGLSYRPEGGRFSGEVIATRSVGKKLSRTNNSCNAAARPASPPFDPGSPATRCFTPPGFWIVDATASFRVAEGATVRAGLFNLFDKKYFWWSDVRGLTDTSVIRDAFSQPRRNFGLSLALSL